MAGAHHTLIPLLILKLINAGVHGKQLSQYVNEGADVSLLCDNVVHSDCSLIMWLHSRESFQNAIQEVFNGKVRVNSKRAKKLSVDADCSLHIHNVTAEDAGRYTCRILKHQNPFSDTDTYLSVLTISLSTLLTYLKPDRPVTIRCSLHTNEGRGKCRIVLNSQVHLSWMDETGRKLQGDSRYQLTGPRCDITLNVTFQKEDNNRKWTCTLTDKGKVKISTDFTFSDIKDTDDDGGEENDGLKQSLLIWVPMGVVVCVAVCVTAVTFRRRAYYVSGNQMPVNPGNQMPVNPGNQMPVNPGNQMPVNPGNQMPVNPGNQMPVNPGNMVQANNRDDQRTDMTYAEVNLPTSRRMVEKDQQTEYATIRT
nr:uncharacterized protein LOC115121422 isoform X2 [Oncorhynchus nerka]